MSRQMQFGMLLIIALGLTGASVVAFGDSHARIVRLSYVDGQVQMDRATGSGLERAILNTPVVQGTRIITGSDGLAEAEFENGSTLRLAEGSEVQFRQLLMNDAGAKVNEIEVVKGTVYLDTRSESDDAYRVAAAATTFLARRNTQMRLTASPDQLQIAVFKGDVELGTKPELVIVKKHETLTFFPQRPSDYELARTTETMPADAWNKEREAYEQAYSASSGYGGPKSGYGLQDLNYYGDFFYAPGYGYAWQPYGFAGSLMSWNPYDNGAWMFYPGMGYSFIASYPWGWLPYHYGSWAFLGGTGWAWIPGGNYGSRWYANGFQNTPKIVKAPAGWTPATPPVATMSNRTNQTILVGRTTSPAYIPGGRMSPDFASVIPRRGLGPSAVVNSFARPSVKTGPANDNLFAGRNTASMTGHRAGHVFAAPNAHAASPVSISSGSAYGGSSVGALGAGAASTGHSVSAGHGSGAAHH